MGEQEARCRVGSGKWKGVEEVDGVVSLIVASQRSQCGTNERQGLETQEVEETVVEARQRKEGKCSSS